MTFDPILNAPIYVQLHAFTAVVAFFLGPFVILRNQRDRLHKIGGYIWVGVMACAAISSFWIMEFRLIGPFSPIHGLSIYVLWSLYRGVSYAVARNIEAHRQTFRGLYVQGLVLAGLFTLLPDRILNRMLFETMPMAGVAVLIVGIVIIGVFTVRRILRRRTGKHSLTL
jgi:uncharacterized membrane protein